MALDFGNFKQLENSLGLSGSGRATTNPFMTGLAGLGSAVDSGINYLGNNAQGIGAATGLIGGLAGAYTNYDSSRKSQNLANQQMAMLQADRQRELARQEAAQGGFETGFADSGILAQRDKEKLGLAATAAV